MAYPYNTNEQAAIARLAAEDSANFANGGHITRFVPRLNDVADVANAVADAAGAASTSATTASTAATDAAAQVGKLAGTSTTSVAIGVGSKSFTTQASKFFEVGRALKIVSAANPTTHFMAGVVSAYSGTSLTVTVAVSGGSGSRADWNIYVSGEVGQAGTLEIGTVTALAPGATPTVTNAGTPSAANLSLGLPVGKPSGLAFTWSTATTNDDPGTGRLKLNSTSFAAATKIYISETDADGRPVAALIATWDDSTSAVKTRLRIFDPVTPTNFAIYAINGLNVDNGGWDTLSVARIDHGGTLTNSMRVYVEADTTGDKGDGGSPGTAATIAIGTVTPIAPGGAPAVRNVGTANAATFDFDLVTGATGVRGAVVAMKYTYSSTTTDSDPGPGFVRFNSATITSATQAFFDDVEAGGVDVSAWLDSFDDSTNTVKGFIEYVVETDPTIRGLFRVSGSVTAGTGYRKVTISNVYALGTPANGAALGIQFIRAGDKGADGLGAGDVIGPASATSDHFVVFDGTTGKLVKGGGAKAASNIAFTPAGSIAASTVQLAIAELDSEKQPLDATLTALAALDGTAGLLEQTGGDTFVRRALGVGASTSVPTRADADGRYLQLTGGTLTGALTLSGDASSSLHAVTKQQFDAALLNLGRRSSARVATTANITIATALNNGDTLDGITLVTGDLILVKNQTAPAENGIYVVGASPARSSEFDTFDEHAGALIAVEEGTANGDTLWLSTANRGGTLNTTAIPFTQLFFAAYTVASTLTLTGQQIALNLSSANTWAAAQTFPNAGLKILDTNASHSLIVSPGSDLTADRTLSIVTGDANRTLTMTGDLTMSGAYNVTLTATATTSVTLPTSGTLATTTQFIGKQSIPLPAASWVARTTNGAASFSTELATNDVMIRGYDFDTSTAEAIQISFPFPKQWNESTITYRVGWTAGSGSGGVAFSLRGRAASDDDAMDGSWGTAITVTDTLTTANDQLWTAESAAVTIGGSPAVGDMIFLELQREVADGSDTLAVDARVMCIEIFITTDAGTDA